MSEDIKRIAVMTSGGDAPGMNAALRAVVRTASYHDLHVYGIFRGYDGLIDGELKRLERSNVGNIIHRGGTILKTARSERFRTTEGRKMAYESLQAFDIDALIAIGGNGTFTGADIFSKEYNIPVIGIPGTIDNDLYGTDLTIGFDTAVNTAIEAVDRIRDTADSHQRLFFIEVMGRHAGYIALHTGIASGAESILIPETETSIDKVVDHLRKTAKRKKLFSLVIVAEGNKTGGAFEVVDLMKEVDPDIDPRVTVIGHLQRGGSPNCVDRVLASRLGYAAVESIRRGESNVMVGLIDNKIICTPFADAIAKQKPIEEDLIKMAEILSL
ncbi:MAG TPA: 6-phosphofructokinase [Saprospiraceae bacterium]|nr:6-phosphofructokinase [Saprospiraceae bacterium]